MRFLKAFMLVCVLCPDQAAYSGELIRPQIMERIQQANAQFEQVAETMPSQRLSVVIFFSRSLGLEGLIDELRVTPLEIKGFRHGNAKASGGYILQPGESLDDAAKRYRESRLAFLELHLESTRRLLANPPNASMVPAIKDSIREADAALDFAKKSDVPVIGVEVEGNVDDLVEFRKLHDYIRVIEIRTERQSNIPPSE